MGQAKAKRTLRLRRGAPQFVEVPLGGDSVIRLRPATRFDIEAAGALVARDLAAVALGTDAAARVAAILGAEFDDGVLFASIKAVKETQDDADAPPAAPVDSAKFVAASKVLGDIYVVMACQGGWSDFALVEGDGDAAKVTPLEAPEPWSIALLLRDPVLHDEIFKVINSRVNAEIAEGEGLPVSPAGGAGIPAGAPTAGGSANPAPTAH